MGSDSNTSYRYSVVTKHRLVMLDINELDAKLFETLAEVNAGLAACVNRQVLLECLLDEFFYGTSLGLSFEEEVGNFGLTANQIANVRKVAMTSVGFQIDSALNGVRPYCRYHYKIVRGTVVVSEAVPPNLRSN